MRYPPLSHIAVASFVSGCSEGSWIEPPARVRQEVIYGLDGRLDYYQAPEAEARLAASAVAAFIPDEFIDEQGDLLLVPTAQETWGLCQDERFSQQPAAAFCSGVLIAPDLVVTAGHCVRIYPLETFSVVFGYYYERSGALALDKRHVFAPLQIVSERLDGFGAEDRLDYAVVRLDRDVAPPLAPVVLDVNGAGVALGAPFTSVSAPDGVPLKVDLEGFIVDTREPANDFFLGISDTSNGSSGGGAFGRNGELLGILGRGTEDHRQSDGGCSRQQHLDFEAGSEEYTRTSSFLTAACDDHPGLVQDCPAIPVMGEVKVRSLGVEPPACSLLLGTDRALRPRHFFCSLLFTTAAFLRLLTPTRRLRA